MITVGQREKDLMYKACKIGKKRYALLLSKLARILGCKDDEKVVCEKMGNACEWLEKNDKKHADIYAKHELKVEPGASGIAMHVTCGTHSFYVYHSRSTLHDPYIPFVVWLKTPRAAWPVRRGDELGEKIAESLEELANLILLANVYKRVWAEAESVELGESEERADKLEKVLQTLGDICKMK